MFDKERFFTLLRQGMTRGEAAEQCGVDRATIRQMIAKDKEFRRRMADAEKDADEMVEEALYQAAISGNVQACLIWLKNRGVGKWAESAERKQPKQSSSTSALGLILSKSELGRRILQRDQAHGNS